MKINLWLVTPPFFIVKPEMKLRTGQTGTRLKDQDSDIVVIAKGGGIAVFGSIIRIGFNFIFRLALTRTLSLGLVGLYFLGTTVIEFSRILALLGLDYGLLKYASIAHGKSDVCQIKGYVITAFKIAIPSAFLFSILLFSFSDTISVQLFHNPDMSKVMRILAITVPFTVITTICVFSTQACKQMQYRVYVQDITEPIVRFAFLGIFIFIGYQLMGALVAYIISVVSSSFLGLYFLNKKLPFSTKGRITRSQVGDFLRFSLTQISSRVIDTLMRTLDIFMIGCFLIIDNVGVYNITVQIVVVGSLFLHAFINIFTPLISELAGIGDFKRIEKNYKAMTKLVIVFSLPVYLIMILFPREILMVFGKDYVAGAGCLVILAAGQMVNSATGAVDVILNMSGKHVLSLYDSIGTLILNIILNFFLIPRYGISGAAVATSTSVVLANLIRLIQVYFIFGIHPYNLSFLKPLFIGTALIVPFGVLRYLFSFELSLPSFLFIITCYTGIYFLFLKLIGLSEEESIIFDKIKAKFSL